MIYIDDILNNQINMNKLAIIDENGQITYRELLESSSLLATALLENGMQGNRSIVIYMEKSIEMIISIFGVQKSGGAYVPLDFDLPMERIGYIISNSRPAFIITNINGMKKIRGGTSIKDMTYVLVDCEFKEGYYVDSNEDIVIIHWSKLCKEQLSIESLNNLKRNENDLAYILFTSGSTGNPKGAMIKHKSVEAFTTAAIKYMGYTENMRTLSISPLYFDVSIPDIFCTLRVGGTLVLMKKFFMPNDLLEALQKYEITDAVMVSSILKLLVSRYSNFEAYSFPNLKTIWYGGETCPIQIIKDLKHAFKNTKFTHGYGQTETTFCATVFTIDIVEDIKHGYFPVGKPLTSVKAYAINENNQLIKPGEVGEIYIGGIQVMEGYCNEEERTNRALVGCIFNPDEKVYRTGDFVTLDEVGNYIFIGRKDDMIKSNGKMVHISEVERALLSCPGVKDVFVLTYVDDLFITKMRAVVVRNVDNYLSKKEIVEHLEKKIPKYMIPHDIQFVNEDQLPKTSTDKIDRSKLSTSVLKY